MEQARQGGVHGHSHRNATEHWTRIRAKKDRTGWIVLAVTVGGAALLGVLYLLLY